jgi:quercetin dioxygenase-like cupin family protein
MPIHHDLLGNLPTQTGRVRNYIANGELGAHSCSAHENILRPGAVIPAHRHSVEEVIVCLDGEGVCRFGDAAPEGYRAGSVLIIPPHTEHTIQNVGGGLLRQISFFAGQPAGTEWTEQQGDVADNNRRAEA